MYFIKYANKSYPSHSLPPGIILFSLDKCMQKQDIGTYVCIHISRAILWDPLCTLKTLFYLQKCFLKLKSWVFLSCGCKYILGSKYMNQSTQPGFWATFPLLSFHLNGWTMGSGAPDKFCFFLLVMLICFKRDFLQFKKKQLSNIVCSIVCFVKLNWQYCWFLLKNISALIQWVRHTWVSPYIQRKHQCKIFF